MGFVETATAVPRSAVSVDITARHHVVHQDKPPGSGGDDRGMMASELLLASLLACQHSTMRKIATKRRTTLDVLRIEGAAHFNDKDDITHLTVRFVLRGPDAREADTLLRLTEKTCTISQVLRVPVHSTATLVA